MRRARAIALAALLVVAALAAGCQEPQGVSEPNAQPPSQAATDTQSQPESQTATETLPGRAVEVMADNSHIKVGAKHEKYSTEPPTSGPHYDQTATAGFQTKAAPDENLVHNLEHGNVIIWYKADDLSDAERTQLFDDIKAVMAAAGVSQYTGTAKLIAVPRKKLKYRVVVTSWGRIDELDNFDAQRVASFIAAFRDEAPEFYED